MINRDFYAFCRDQRKIEPDPEKHAALVDVYSYMWECGITKGGVALYIAVRIDQLSNGERSTTKVDTSQEKRHTLRDQQIDAYQWLLSVFQGEQKKKSVEVEPEQGLWCLGLHVESGA